MRISNFTRAEALSIAVCFWAFSTPSHAASFECSLARTPIEKAICADPELSSLDSDLDKTYRKALQGLGDSAGPLQNDQRTWLKSRRPSNGPINVPQLQSEYRDRIALLSEMPVFPKPSDAVEGPTLRVTRASKQLDFTIRMLSKCDALARSGYRSCEGPGQVLISRKGEARVVQTINMSNIFVSMTDTQKPLVNSANLYDFQGVINVGDFNFDGREDFAIRNGNNGSYGGPTYDVYLSDRASGRFVFNEAMSELVMETLGFFEVDSRHKVIRTTAKSGCCYHEFTTYRVENNTPVAIANHIEALTADGTKMEIRDERFVNGKWQSKTHYERAPD